MTRSSRFETRPHGAYFTPVEPVLHLIPYLPTSPTRYAEPCCGEGHMVQHLGDLWPAGTATVMSDIVVRKRGAGFRKARAEAWPSAWADDVDLFITNPPWPTSGSRGEPVLSIIRHLTTMHPVWLLLPASFAFNTYFSEVIRKCQRIVPAGRASWAGNGVQGTNDSAWFEFRSDATGGPVIMPRQPRKGGRVLTAPDAP